jgi:hypothetical protein
MTIYIMALEPLDTRYTGQWFNGLPHLIREEAKDRGLDVEVVNLAGEQTSTEVTTGAFLDFFATNIWKNTQVNELVRRFQKGEVKAGDKVLFTDAWHSGVTQVRYMSELMQIPVEIHSMWHAGSYDPQDFLGRLIQDKRWTHNAERGFFYASHFNYFATEFHRDLLINTLISPLESWERYDNRRNCVISGQPHNALVEGLKPFYGMKKERLVLFPHRIAPEKQVEIFRDLATHIPDAEFVVCQETKLTKDEYHSLLGRSMLVFSANLQETLGISAMEGVLVESIPFVPNRLSYTEMYDEAFLYPSEWTTSWDAYEAHRDEIVRIVRYMLDHYEDYLPALRDQGDRLMNNYLTCKPMLDRLLHAPTNFND